MLSFADFVDRIMVELGLKPIYVTTMPTEVLSGILNRNSPSRSVTKALSPSFTRISAPASGLPVSSSTLPTKVSARAVSGDRSPKTSVGKYLRLLCMKGYFLGAVKVHIIGMGIAPYCRLNLMVISSFSNEPCIEPEYALPASVVPLNSAEARV